MFRKKKPEFGSEERFLSDLSVESLESREMLAGEVDVFVSGGNVVVQGDAGNNVINVVDNGGQLEVQGVGTTTVNGGATGLDIADLNNLTIHLNNGDDRVNIRGISADQLRVNTGNGADRDNVNNNTTANLVSIRTGLGVDEVNVNATDANRMFIKTGHGLSGDTVDLTNTTVVRRLSVRTGAGGDTVNTANLTSTGKTFMRLGSGDDVLTVDGGEFGDTIVRMNTGNDTVNVVGIPTLNGRVNLHGGAGVDQLTPGVVGTDGVRARRFEFV